MASNWVMTEARQERLSEIDELAKSPREIKFVKHLAEFFEPHEVCLILRAAVKSKLMPTEKGRP